MMLIWIALLSLASGEPFLATKLEEAEDPSTGEVFFSNFTAKGNGCPEGTTSHSLSIDRKSIYVSFDSYHAYSGPGTSVKDRRPSCDLEINLTHPAEFQYSVTNTIYHGYVVLDKNMIGVMQAVYSFASPSQHATTEGKISGPVRDVFTIDVNLKESARIWSPCGVQSPLVMRTRIALTSRSVETSTLVFPGTLEEDSPISLTWVIGIGWRKCSE